MTRLRKSFLAIMLLLFFPQTGKSDPVLDEETSACVEEVNQMGHLNFFTWSAKQILDALAGSEFLKEKEWKTVELNPRLALYIKEAADLGLEISEGLCPFDPTIMSNTSHAVDDEVDAIRHFVMSSYLAWKVGPQPARRFMAAHEDSLFENDNMMDYYNNNLGFEFGAGFRRRQESQSLLVNPLPTFLTEIRSEIRRKFELPRGDDLDFIVLKSGPSTCARRKYPNF